MRTGIYVFTALAVTSFFGCAAHRTDLVQAGFVTLESQLTTTFPNPPRVYDEDGSLLVDGLLNDPQTGRGGHVDVTVVAPDGIVVYDAQVSFRRHVTGSIPGRRGRVARHPSRGHYHYSIRFPGLPPEGAIVRVRLDPEPHDAQRHP